VNDYATERPVSSEADSDCVALAQELIRIQSVNPPGGEYPCVSLLGSLLKSAGMTVHSYEFEPGRPSIVATAPGTDDVPPLCFTGHVDVVPLGNEPWSVDPFAGVIRDGKLYGRGSSDMKCGVAAFVTATISKLREGKKLRRGIKLVITAGEETGCQGAFHLVNSDALGDCSLLVVAEPSSNEPIIAHKGSLRIRVDVHGRTAHSSMPELGDNAIEAVADMISALRRHVFSHHHELLGGTSTCVSLIEGGMNINSVPDFASFSVDFRTVPSHSHTELLADVAALLGERAQISVITDFPGFATAKDDPALEGLVDIITEQLGRTPEFRGAPYFTDASALVPGFAGVAAVVLGPGEVEQCHRTDEFCFVGNIEKSHAIYQAIIDKHCR